jgi:hypothetical protein
MQNKSEFETFVEKYNSWIDNEQSMVYTEDEVQNFESILGELNINLRNKIKGNILLSAKEIKSMKLDANHYNDFSKYLKAKYFVEAKTAEEIINSKVITKHQEISNNQKFGELYFKIKLQEAEKDLSNFYLKRDDKTGKLSLSEYNNTLGCLIKLGIEESQYSVLFSDENYKTRIPNKIQEYDKKSYNLIIQPLIICDFIKIINAFLDDKEPNPQELFLVKKDQADNIYHLLNTITKDRVKEYTELLSDKNIHQLDKEGWFIKIINYLCETRLYKNFTFLQLKPINDYIKKHQNFQSFIKDTQKIITQNLLQK